MICSMPWKTAFSLLTLMLSIMLICNRWSRTFQCRKIYWNFLLVHQMHWSGSNSLSVFPLLLFGIWTRTYRWMKHISCNFIGICCQFSSIEILFYRVRLIHRFLYFYLTNNWFKKHILIFDKNNLFAILILYNLFYINRNGNNLIC